MAAEGLIMLKAGLDVAKAAKEFLSSSAQKEYRLNDQVCTALRGLYFTPSGVISLLKQIARGDKVPASRVEQALTEFNDKEWKVRDALDSLDFDRLAKELGLTLRTARALDEVRYGKMSLRQDIQSEVNYYGQRNVKLSREKIRDLIQRIEQLNFEIVEIEHLVNLRAQER